MICLSDNNAVSATITEEAYPRGLSPDFIQSWTKIFPLNEVQSSFGSSRKVCQRPFCQLIWSDLKSRLFLVKPIFLSQIRRVLSIKCLSDLMHCQTKKSLSYEDSPLTTASSFRNKRKTFSTGYGTRRKPMWLVLFKQFRERKHWCIICLTDFTKSKTSKHYLSHGLYQHQNWFKFNIETKTVLSNNSENLSHRLHSILNEILYLHEASPRYITWKIWFVTLT